VAKCEVGGHIEGLGEKRDACRLLVKEPEGKNLLLSRRCRLEDNIKMDPQ
jgi:hypothetical protein